jgi:hypothetical protein
MEKTETLKTTLGELIVALTEEAIQLVPNERVAYRVVAYALRDLVYDSEARSKGLGIRH